MGWEMGKTKEKPPSLDEQKVAKIIVMATPGRPEIIGNYPQVRIKTGTYLV